MGKWTDDQLETLRQGYGKTSVKTLSEKIGKTPNAVRTKASREDISGNYKTDGGLLRRLETSESKEFKGYKDFGHFITGFVAGEGSFVRTERTERKGSYRYKFAISVSNVDVEIIEHINDFFQYGRVIHKSQRDEKWKPNVEFRVENIVGLVQEIIPFFEAYSLHNTHKLQQYQEWKSQLYTDKNIPERYRY